MHVTTTYDILTTDEREHLQKAVLGYGRMKAFQVLTEVNGDVLHVATIKKAIAGQEITESKLKRIRIALRYLP